MDVVEENQATIREEMDMMNGNIEQLLEDMMAMARKEDNPHIIVDTKNIVSQLGSSSLRIPEVNNPEFGLPLRHIPPEGVTNPPPIRISVENLAAQDPYAPSIRQRSLYNEEDPQDQQGVDRNVYGNFTSSIS